jgi:hypothetical protein
MQDAPSEYDVSDLVGSSVAVHRLGNLPWRERAERAAAVVHATGLPVYAHLTSPKELEGLWSAGCRMIPVVHNVAAGWNQDPGTWNHPSVSFVAACGDQIHEEVRRAGYEGEIRTLRHVLSPLRRPGASRREALRCAFGCGADTLLMGMVGRVVFQKRYTRAVVILTELVRRGVDARLAIIGVAVGEEGRAARTALLATAATAGVGGRLSLPGPVADATAVIGAFDVFLNTSIHEGVSIATMEAAAMGLPIVSADVGGQREAVPPGDALLDSAEPEEVWADAVMVAAGRQPSSPAGRAAWLAPLAAASWAWLAALGPNAACSGRDGGGVLFLTANMDVGGAQRSLCNLAEALAGRGAAVTTAVLGPVGVPGFTDAARAAGARFLSLAPLPGDIESLVDRTGRILALTNAMRPQTLCFWNVDAPTKLAMAKVIAGGAIRLTDASPGPMFYAELEDAGELACGTASPSAWPRRSRRSCWTPCERHGWVSRAGPGRGASSRWSGWRPLGPTSPSGQAVIGSMPRPRLSKGRRVNMRRVLNAILAMSSRQGPPAETQPLPAATRKSPAASAAAGAGGIAGAAREAPRPAVPDSP